MVAENVGIAPGLTCQAEQTFILPHADGHCPAHESPRVVNELIAKYVDWCERGCVGDAPEGSACGVGRLVDGSPRNFFERADAAVAGSR